MDKEARRRGERDYYSAPDSRILSARLIAPDGRDNAEGTVGRGNRKSAETPRRNNRCIRVMNFPVLRPGKEMPIVADNAIDT